MEAQLQNYLKQADAFLLEYGEKAMAELPVTFSPIGSIVAVYAVGFVVFLLAALFGILTGTTNNATPRDHSKSALVRRLKGAHFNTLENTYLFAIAVILCLANGVDNASLTMFCNLFVLVRAVYCVAYAFAFHSALSIIRTAVFAVGLLVNMKLFVLAGTANGGFLYKLK